MIREDLTPKEFLNLLLKYQEYFQDIQSRALPDAQGKVQIHPTDKHFCEQTLFYSGELLRKNGHMEEGAYLRRYGKEENLNGVLDILKTAIAHEQTARKMYWKTAAQTAPEKPKPKPESRTEIAPAPLQLPEKVTMAWAWRNVPVSVWMGGLSILAGVFTLGYQIGTRFH
jgi:hypothetical protein